MQNFNRGGGIIAEQKANSSLSQLVNFYREENFSRAIFFPIPRSSHTVFGHVSLSGIHRFHLFVFLITQREGDKSSNIERNFSFDVAPTVQPEGTPPRKSESTSNFFAKLQQLRRIRIDDLGFRCDVLRTVVAPGFDSHTLWSITQMSDVHTTCRFFLIIS